MRTMMVEGVAGVVSTAQSMRRADERKRALTAVGLWIRPALT